MPKEKSECVVKIFIPSWAVGHAVHVVNQQLGPLGYCLGGDGAGQVAVNGVLRVEVSHTNHFLVSGYYLVQYTQKIKI